MRWPRLRRWGAYRWQAAVVGLETGHVTPLAFTRFRTRRRAQAWVDRMNAKHPSTMMRYEVREIAQ
jgi:hypothetical protein